MFTDRFITVPIKTFDVKHKEMTGEEITTNSYTKFNPFDIASYRPVVDEKENCVKVSLKCGDGFYAYLHIKEFEKLLNDIK